MNEKLVRYAREIENLAIDLEAATVRDDMEETGINLDMLMEAGQKMLEILDKMEAT